MNARFRERRSSFAITSRALRFRQSASASLSSGRSLRFPVSISVNSAMGAVAPRYPRTAACCVKSRPSPSRVPRRPPEGSRADIVHSSLYLPGPVYEALRETAFHERSKIHSIIVEGIELALRKRGYPALDDLKAGKKR
jgi:hypothetical protein